MTDKSIKGRGGQPAKIVLRTKFGWVAEQTASERSRANEIIEYTRAALRKANAPDVAFARAFTIMRTYRRKIELLDNPKANYDKNGKGVGRFKSDLRKRSEKMADHIDQALNDEASHDLNSLIIDSDIRSHMEAAYESLIAIVELIDRSGEGEKPSFSYADIRHEAGSKLKALAREHGLPKMEFVKAFNIHPQGINFSEDAFNKWYQRLDG